MIFPILFLIFSSEIWLPHAPHDNTRYFSKEEYNKIISQCEADSQYIWLNNINRPVAARIECLTFNLTKNLYDLSYLRILIIVFLSVIVIELIYLFCYSGISDVTSFAMAISLACLPGVQNLVFMTNFVNTLSFALSLYAAILFNRIDFGQKISNQMYLHKKLFALIFLFLLVSNLAYPVFSFVFFWGLLIYLMTNKQSLNIKFKKLIFCVLIFFSSLLLAFMLSKIALPKQYIIYSKNIPESYSLDLNLSNIIRKIPNIVFQVVYSSSSMWFMQHHFMNKINCFVILFFIFVNLIFLIKNKKKLKQALGESLLIISTYFLNFIPFLISKSPLFFMRTLYPSMGGFVLIFIYVSKIFYDNWSSFFKTKYNSSFLYSAFFFAILGIFYSNYCIFMNTLNTYMEMIYVKSELNKNLTPPRRVHIIKSVDDGKGYNGLKIINDEFNQKTTNFNQDILNFLKICYLDEIIKNNLKIVFCDYNDIYCDKKIPKNYIILSYSENYKNLCKTNNMQIIDMNNLTNFMQKKMQVKKTKIPFCKESEVLSIVSDGKSDERHTIQRIFFDDVEKIASQDGFWETSLEKPVNLFIAYKQKKLVKSYTIGAGESSNRMPIAWYVYGSNDNKKWTLIDSKKNIFSWEYFKNKKFTINHANHYRFYRFNFTKSNNENILRIYKFSIDYVD
ncbi:MAG: hypothetical protein EBQ95_02730 [Gammaproteobacteria bacterium]|nr:hypothetical protein [Gammaproteobacteria bacterium]